ncbi:hypothetical protein H6G97_48655 [Nostoc flagelliforme FACHB-838]|uniref:Uncharacterized protein n=1 Tax=Nostoc flagelliforme FACHB-838 TaxID=2692904 RepID=A0ABR8E5X4_9NOSO|nr:hypothetical protein [Nostoc flagelliforme FACHB-838]
MKKKQPKYLKAMKRIKATINKSKNPSRLLKDVITKKEFKKRCGILKNKIY